MTGHSLVPDQAPKCRAGAAVVRATCPAFFAVRTVPSRRRAGSAARVLVTVQPAAGQLQGVDEKVCSPRRFALATLVAMDNLGSHRSPKVRQAIESQGASPR
jgi:hypothetical protein